MSKRLASTLVLVFGITVFATSAYAGNGNGNGNGHGNGNGKPDAGPPAATEQGSAPGNSGNAPGHVKKDDAPAEETGTPAIVATAPDSVAPEGVKPSSTTEHDTHAAASSNDTKLYGNGRTAGQIAIQRGAAPSTVLHGPGNSQPHKVTPCAGGHEVDVHALKGKRQAGCATSSPPTPAPVPVPGPNPGPGGGPTSDPEVHGSNSSPAPSQPATPPTGKPADPVSTASDPELAAESEARSSGGVLAQRTFAASGNLPFTGFPLWIAVIVGTVLILLGLVLKRRGRQPAS